ncbi:hypothetical protein U717_08480 [Rhodobacter capsulatus R121]|nr:hypothetical protein U714_08310 [Rhodobacter capsulatus DE442]ETD77379.1 hypothetical protein U717_08480 [Rhodobacter capsulatus R121]ETE54079.1 hypothetical protein U715_08480 [Rhodobacter capsulatus Y262]
MARNGMVKLSFDRSSTTAPAVVPEAMVSAVHEIKPA